MPQGSYRIVGEKDGPKSIEIVNPDRFWSLCLAPRGSDQLMDMKRRLK